MFDSRIVLQVLSLTRRQRDAKSQLPVHHPTPTHLVIVQLQLIDSGLYDWIDSEEFYISLDWSYQKLNDSRISEILDAFVTDSTEVILWKNCFYHTAN